MKIIGVSKKLSHVRRQGFTLVELLVVIAIIGLLSTVAVVATNQARTKAKYAKATAEVKLLKDAMIRYNIDTGLWPGNGVNRILESRRYDHYF